MGQPHKHVEVIKAWADGAEIEWREVGDSWRPARTPPFLDQIEYRIKPEPPAKVYPQTRMTQSDYNAAINTFAHVGTCTSIANAALRHAIDNNQVITVADHKAEMEKLSLGLRDYQLERHAARDMAIARAVEEVYCKLVPHKTPNSDYYLECIIATVKD